MEFVHSPEHFEEARREEIKSLLAELLKSPELVLVELGADCDHAQNTKRTRRFLLALELPETFAVLMKHPDTKMLKNQSLKCLGPWIVGGRIVHLLVSCRRFVGWQTKAPDAKVRYRLRAPVVSMLLHHYSSWHSRPGIVEF
jgi:hypothetical protein